MSVPPGVMVAKAIFLPTTLTDGCKEINFIEFSDKLNNFCETINSMMSKIPHSCETHLFTKISDSCKGKNMLCYHQPTMNMCLFLKTRIILCFFFICKFHFLYFKVNLKNPQLDLEYLIHKTNV